jgi:hypothetical protein
MELDYGRLGFALVAAVLMTKLTIIIINRAAHRGAEPEGTDQ